MRSLLYTPDKRVDRIQTRNIAVKEGKQFAPPVVLMVPKCIRAKQYEVWAGCAKLMLREVRNGARKVVLQRKFSHKKGTVILPKLSHQQNNEPELSHKAHTCSVFGKGLRLGLI